MATGFNDNWKYPIGFQDFAQDDNGQHEKHRGQIRDQQITQWRRDIAEALHQAELKVVTDPAKHKGDTPYVIITDIHRVADRAPYKSQSSSNSATIIAVDDLRNSNRLESALDYAVWLINTKYHTHEQWDYQTLSDGSVEFRISLDEQYPL
jgi:hypothetical protein